MIRRRLAPLADPAAHLARPLHAVVAAALLLAAPAARAWQPPPDPKDPCDLDARIAWYDRCGKAMDENYDRISLTEWGRRGDACRAGQRRLEKKCEAIQERERQEREKREALRRLQEQREREAREAQQRQREAQQRQREVHQRQQEARERERSRAEQERRELAAARQRAQAARDAAQRARAQAQRDRTSRILENNRRSQEQLEATINAVGTFLQKLDEDERAERRERREREAQERADREAREAEERLREAELRARELEQEGRVRESFRVAALDPEARTDAGRPGPCSEEAAAANPSRCELDTRPFVEAVVAGARDGLSRPLSTMVDLAAAEHPIDRVKVVADEVLEQAPVPEVEKEAGKQATTIIAESWKCTDDELAKFGTDQPGRCNRGGELDVVRVVAPKWADRRDRVVAAWGALVEWKNCRVDPFLTRHLGWAFRSGDDDAGEDR